MMASVYCTMEGGVKLPRPKDKVPGNLLLKRAAQGDATWLSARLVENGVDVLRPLIKAEVREISEHGIVIHGQEIITRTASSKSGSRVYPQVWWVFVWTSMTATTHLRTLLKWPRFRSAVLVLDSACSSREV
jgi:hypothetical protein